MKMGTVRWLGGLLVAIGLAGSAGAASSATADVAVAVALTNDWDNLVEDMRDAAEMARDDTNADEVLNAQDLPPIHLGFFDDRGTAAGAGEVARQLCAGDMLAIIGPTYSNQIIASSPVYAQCGMAALTPSAHLAHIAHSETTFHGVYTTETMGETFADYVHYALHVDRAVVVAKRSDYGREVADGFRRGAGRLGIAADFRDFDTDEEAAALAKSLSATAQGRALIIATAQDQEVVKLLIALRGAGWQGPMIGTDALARDNFADRFRQEEEIEHRKHGYFIDGLYASAPAILDYADGKTLAFADRFQTRYRHLPNWAAVATYQSGRVLMVAARLAGQGSIAARRQQLLAQLSSLDGPEPQRDGPPGSPWFNNNQGVRLPVRIGRFHDGMIESAPLQLAAAANAGPEEIASGAVVPVADGYARLQHVVYAGFHLNDLGELDIAKSSFKADFYLWMRYADDRGPGSIDPLDIAFPDLLGRTSDAARLAEKTTLPDGMIYSLFQVRGSFRGDFDLHRYPFDSQSLAIRFFNGPSASDRIIYALDRRSPPLSAQLEPPSAMFDGATSPFRGLTEWTADAAKAGRHLMVTDSALGDPRLAGADRRRELSGFQATIEIRRRVMPVMAKTLLPLSLMTLILLASHFFAGALENHRVGVAITGVLSGAVLLTAIESQLGEYGYTMEVDYIFYVFFFLCFLSIAAATLAEGFERRGDQVLTRRTFLVARYLSILIILVSAGIVSM
ncbi:MAG TPA: ABC transporter substrate-binding protein [Magnetospirillaceae bacterium]|nr:ABC transporter substrate-binding protein [Magnetospirillaceae bacterium]